MTEELLAAVFWGGPGCGMEFSIPMGVDLVAGIQGGRMHVYEFDPVTEESSGRWMYRYRGERAGAVEALRVCLERAEEGGGA